MSERTRVLFVCLGNICRSPTAEVVFRTAAARAGLASLVEIDSAGTGDWHVGDAPDPRAIAHAARRGYDLRPLRARHFSIVDFRRFDWILAMDRNVLRELLEVRPDEFEGHIGLFLDIAPELGELDVPDPYFGGAQGFERVLDLVEAASDALAKRIVASGDQGPTPGSR